ncbi:MAG: FIST signal transduction protein [Bacteroidia bacterium]
MRYTQNLFEDALAVWNAHKVADTDQLLVLIAENNAPDLESFRAFCNEHNINAFGGIFTGVIHNEAYLREGALLSVVAAPVGVHVVHKEGEHPVFSPELSALQLPADQDWSVITMLDGLMENISNMLAGIHNLFGETANFFGGGAGSLSLVQQLCLFTNKGVYQDAALLCPIPLKSNIGVRHGWSQIYGPVVATRTEGNVVHELNWEPAFEVYSKIVSDDAGVTLSKDDFFAVAKAYPFGIYREREEFIVRDPLSVREDGAIVCVGEVPENTVLNILKGNKETLLKAAKEAGNDAVSQQDSLVELFVVDCISRTLFLEDDFSKEIAMVKEAVSSKSPSGILSLGEIATEKGSGLLSFFNKTIVVSALYHESAS